jgi:integral membrane protein (TIGR00529 family)
MIEETVLQLAHSPALIKISVTFFFMLLLSRVLPLYAGILLGSVLISLWMGLSLLQFASSLWREVTAFQTLGIELIIAMILVLGDLLKRTGQLDRIVSSFGLLSSGSRLTAAALPALIGLLPMPGGAIFSAPMLETALQNDSLEPELKVAINYWFRHICEFWWPLGPGLILAISLLGVPSWEVLAAQFPLTVGSLVAGIIFILPLVPNRDSAGNVVSGENLRVFAREVMPITLVVAVLFGTEAVLQTMEYSLGRTFAWPKHLSFVLALGSAVMLVIRRNSVSLPAVRAAVFNRNTISMIAIVLAIMVFKGVLIDSHAIEQVQIELTDSKIPPLLIIAILPLIAGFVTGIAVGFVGASFPLVMTLFPEGCSPLPFAMLAYGFGFMGMMLSPIHVCLLVSQEYFAAEMTKGYRYLWKPVLFSLGWTIALFLLYHSIPT